METLNKFKLISLIALITIGFNTVNAQCNYNVYAIDSLNPPGITFLSNATGSTYFWDFGDGNTSTQQSPVHIYNAPGAYYYCLTVDSCPPVCDSVIVMGCNINASYTVVDNGGGSYSFTNTSVGGTHYYWNFGDGNTSTQANPNHTYLTNGTYTIFFQVLDSLCQDSIWQQITVTVSNPCNYNVYAIDSLNPPGITFLSNATGSTYFWDFGDGNTSTQQSPVHIYNAPGAYYYCLTVDSCPPVCDSIFVQTTAIDENEEVITNLLTYPNPVRDYLTIELNLKNEALVEITIVDLIGNTIDLISNETMSSGKNQLQWNTRNISNGVYLLTIKTNNNLQVKKLVVNK